MIKLTLTITLLATITLTDIFAQTPLVTRGPYLNLGTSSSVVLRWRTDITSDTKVWYGTQLDTATMASSLNLAPTTEHELNITGLQASTRYYYAIGSSGNLLSGPDSGQYFQTSPPPGSTDPIRIWAIGDFGEGNSQQVAVKDAFLDFTNSKHTDVWLWLGDNAYDDGRDEEYQVGAFDIYPEIFSNTVLWPTLGNHDYGSTYPVIDLTNQPYLDMFTLPKSGEAGGVPSGDEGYYSYDYGNIHFISLNSEDYDYSIDLINQTINIDHNPAMITWLENDLAANANKDWVIAYWHQPPYSRGTHTETNSSWSYVDGLIMRTMRDNIVPILESSGVDLVLSGHSHSYERSYLVHGNYGQNGPYPPDSTLVDGSTGSASAGSPYIKLSTGVHANKGTIYSVVGTSAKTGNYSSDGALDHPLMYAADYRLGSMVIEVSGNQLNAYFIDTSGTAWDEFSIIKDFGVVGLSSEAQHLIKEEESIFTNLSVYPNPFNDQLTIEYQLQKSEIITIEITDLAGKTLTTIINENQKAGNHSYLVDAKKAGLIQGVFLLQFKTAGALKIQKTIGQ